MLQDLVNLHFILFCLSCYIWTLCTFGPQFNLLGFQFLCDGCLLVKEESHKVEELRSAKLQREYYFQKNTCNFIR